MDKSMTALVSAFARAYHSESYKTRVFNDTLARGLLGEKEYGEITMNMTAGRSFFLPGFNGTDSEALEKIVANQLAPTPLGRAAFCEKKLGEALSSGVKQVLVLASGYDTTLYARAEESGARIFEVDLPPILQDKQGRLKRAGVDFAESIRFIPADLSEGSLREKLQAEGSFKADEKTFCSLMGLVYYIEKQAFSALLKELTRTLKPGSRLVFDVPVLSEATYRTEKQQALARAAGEPMKTGYSEVELSRLLEESGYKVKKSLSPSEITEGYFAEFNRAYPKAAMTAFEGVYYYEAVVG